MRKQKWPKASELQQKIGQYQQALNRGDFPRASWPHLASYLELTEDDLRDMLQEDSLRAQILRRTATWMRGQILSSEGWSGPNATKGVFLLRQDVGDGIRYTDRPEKEDGEPPSIHVTFGCGQEAFD